MTKTIEKRTREDWWITTEFLNKGGEKVAGPFGSRDLALNHRALIESRDRRSDLFVDSEPLALW